jgi:hypothetical protein
LTSRGNDRSRDYSALAAGTNPAATELVPRLLYVRLGDDLQHAALGDTPKGTQSQQSSELHPAICIDFETTPLSSVA